MMTVGFCWAIGTLVLTELRRPAVARSATAADTVATRTRATAGRTATRGATTGRPAMAAGREQEKRSLEAFRGEKPRAYLQIAG